MSDYKGTTSTRQDYVSSYRNVITSPQETNRNPIITSYIQDPSVVTGSNEVKKTETSTYQYQPGRVQSQRNVSSKKEQRSQSPAFVQPMYNPCFNPCYNPCNPSPSICVTQVVVSKEDIEAPWREEYQYLYNLIEELEKNQKTEVQVVKEIDNTRVEELEGVIRELRNQLNLKRQSYEARLAAKKRELDEWRERINDLQYQIQELSTQEIVKETVVRQSNEAELWKTKAVKARQDKAAAEIRLAELKAQEAILKKEKELKMKEQQLERRSKVTTVTKRSQIE